MGSCLSSRNKQETGSAAAGLGHTMEQHQPVVAQKDFDAVRQAVEDALTKLEIKSKDSPPRAYEYKPLDTGHIRLLKITSTKDSLLHRVEIIHVPLEGDKSFEALSYCWGTDGQNYRIPIHGPGDQIDGYVRLTKGLLESLFYITKFWEINDPAVPRPTKQEKHIWVDQLCINQMPDSNKADSEKAEQIAIMDQIYSKAERVLVWLACGLNYEQLESLIRFAQSKNEVDLRAIMDDPDIETDLGEAVRYIWSRPWFQRSWVTQETSVAKNFCFLVGLHSFSWGELVFPFSVSATHSGTGNIYPDAVYIGKRISADSLWKKCSDSAGNSSKAEQGVHLFRFMMHSRNFQAGDARDKVMAYYSLWKSLAPTFNPKNYSASASSVYTNMAAAITKHTECLDILGAHQNDCHKTTYGYDYKTGVDEMRVEGDSLPSWVPNWDDEAQNRWCSTILRARSVETSEIEWDASRGRSHRGGLPSSDPSDLWTRGKVLCTVENLFPVIGEDDYRLAKFQESLVSPIPEQTIPLQAAVSAVLFCSSLTKKLDYMEVGSVSDTINALRNAQRTRTETLSREWIETPLPAWMHAVQNLTGRRFVMLRLQSEPSSLMEESGRLEEQVKIGLVPCSAQEKDVIAILHGCRFPVVLRELPSSGVSREKLDSGRKKEKEERYYEFVGDCYVHGIMFGEAVQWEEHAADDIVLV